LQATLNAYVVSNALIEKAAKETNEGDFETPALFLSMVVLLCVLRSVFMLFLTLWCFLASMGASSGVLYLIIKWTNLNVATTAPSLMRPIGLAMSIDYCLFMMHRYRAEQKTVWTTLLEARASAAALGEARAAALEDAEAARNDGTNKSIKTMQNTSGKVVSNAT
jgi:uncharacterized membrane protein YdfJ with MMPL/SSD domain